MKNIKIILMVFLALNFTGCFEDTTIDDDIAKTTNLVTFSSENLAVSATADGNEFTKEVNLKFVGPRLDQVTNQVTVNVSVDPASTAIEGTHYRMDQTQVTFGPDDNFLAKLPFAMLTAGIVPPLDENPVLILNLSNASGDPTVITSGKKITINLLYLCFGDLSGTYVVTNDFCAPTFTATISSNPDGSWHISSADGGFLHQCTSNTALLNPGDINEVCGEIQPTDNLDYGGLGIGVIEGGTWDQDNGILTMQHSDTFFNGGPFSWESTYTRQ